MSSGVIDVGKFRHLNSRLLAATLKGAEGGCEAILRSAQQIARDTTTIKSRSGALRNGWQYQLIRSRVKVGGKLWNSVKHALFQEEGTGVFGPNRAPYWIEPRNAKCLRFQVASGQIVFARRVLHYGVHPRFIGRAAMYGRQAMFFGTDHERNIRLLTRWISGELARVK